jgi:hypothetical protein
MLYFFIFAALGAKRAALDKNTATWYTEVVKTIGR